jgi:hypothetical protein
MTYTELLRIDPQLARRLLKRTLQPGDSITLARRDLLPLREARYTVRYDLEVRTRA